MHRRRLAALAAAGTVLLPVAALAAAPDDCRLIRGADTVESTDDDARVCSLQVWFHDSGRKVGNLAAAGHAAMPSWDTTRPTASMSTGAGGTYVANSFTEIVGEEFGPESGPTFTGTFTGTLDTLAVDLYVIDPLRRAQGRPASVRTMLEVDGQSVYVEEQAVDVAASTDGQLRRLQFAYTGLYDQMRRAKLDLGPGAEHTIRLSVLVFFFGTEAAFVYDSAEAPSGIAFNLDDTSLQPYTRLGAP